MPIQGYKPIWVDPRGNKCKSYIKNGCNDFTARLVRKGHVHAFSIRTIIFTDGGVELGYKDAFNMDFTYKMTVEEFYEMKPRQFEWLVFGYDGINESMSLSELNNKYDIHTYNKENK